MSNDTTAEDLLRALIWREDPDAPAAGWTLAQQLEWVQAMLDGRMDSMKTLLDNNTRLQAELERERAARRQAQESLETYKGQCVKVEGENERLRGTVAHLQAARRPLSDEQIDELLKPLRRDFWGIGDFRALIRAVERAHGIGIAE